MAKVADIARTFLRKLEFPGDAAAEQAKGSIRQAEGELRQLLDLTPMHITELGPDGSLLYINRAALEYHGLTLDQWRNADLHSLVHPQDAERLTRELLRKFESGSPYELEARLKRRDGQHRWFLVRIDPMLDEEGRLKRWYSAATDIDDRKQAEEKLLRSQAYLAEAQRLTHNGSFVGNVATGELTHASEEFFRVFGFDPTRGLPSTEEFHLRVHPEDRDRTRSTYARTVDERTDFEMDFRIVLPDGTIKHLHAIGHPVFNAAGELVEHIGNVMDVTERKRAEEAHAQLERRLRQAEKMEALGRLAGGIAHDFNNVLSGILAYAEMLFEETPESSPLKRYAQNVLAAGNRGRALVEQILLYSRSQRGKRAPVEVAGVVAEALELVRGTLPTNIGLEAGLPESSLVVLGDATRLHQVVMNLCSNAIQAMSGGGTLRVALEAAELGAE
ncbi:MAG TPA: PAS domain-containing protein, partial [Burkholderiales bacterium]|nr:PAS domain-containing protein [Burkholderiales bacterium]